MKNLTGTVQINEQFMPDLAVKLVFMLVAKQGSSGRFRMHLVVSIA